LLDFAVTLRTLSVGLEMSRSTQWLLATVSVCLTLTVCLAAFAGPGGGDRVTGQPFATRSPVIAQHGIAATSQPLATQIAIDTLKAGGSAVDAAIGANAALGLMEPTGNGIGGDLFAIVWDPKTRKLYGLNASGRAPEGLSYEKLKTLLGDQKNMPLFGPLPITVPGAVDGWFTLHGRFGKLPMKEILVPAIRYARVCRRREMRLATTTRATAIPMAI
jgi:gamma-glutamyltranspeptidase / glutathione hydrolase